MSREIGRVGRVSGDRAQFFVHVSIGGVEIASDEQATLDPSDARTLANLLHRAADDAERMKDDREYGDLLRRADEWIQRYAVRDRGRDLMRELVDALRGVAPAPEVQAPPSPGWESWTPSMRSAGVCVCGGRPAWIRGDKLRCSACVMRDPSL
jgi:hypothetical protein